MPPMTTFLDGLNRAGAAFTAAACAVFWLGAFSFLVTRGVRGVYGFLTASRRRPTLAPERGGDG